jgi:hypothetical protein
VITYKGHNYYACCNCRMSDDAAETEREELLVKINEVLSKAESLALDSPADRAKLRAMLMDALS